PPPPRAGPSLLDQGLTALRELLLGGNTVVRVGVLVLLVGVLLLAKWAVDNALFPVEARLAVSALIGLALTGVGYRVREARPGFGTTLQGGGIAALYLVVFVALRIFALLPAGFAFVLFIAVAVAGGLLAVLQRSQPLIFIGSLGGFLAPVLASTGEGSHVVLFGYYLVLNAAIAAAAWLRAWRPLNLLAFVCTYGVAAAWGVLRYRPDELASTEPFVVAYLVLFTGIAVVFAWRRPPRLAGLVDGTLVFGTALVTLLAQARLVEDVPYGMAYSSAALGLFYAALGTWLWRTAPDTLRRLCEAFVALAVGFGTLAIPFALDDGLGTSMAWALEGAGVYWVGTRQGRRYARAAGVALQGLAALAFVWGLDAGLGGGPREIAERLGANARFFACAALAFAGGFIAREAWARRDDLGAREWQATQALAAWGLLWWLGGAVADVDQFVETRFEIAALLFFTAATALGQELAGARLGWTPGRWLALWCLPAGFLWLGLAMATQPHLLANGGAVAWPLLVATAYGVLGRLEPARLPGVGAAYVAAFSLVALVVPIAAFGLADEVGRLSGDWPLAAFGVALAALLLAGGRAVERGVGPFGRLAQLHRRAGLVPAVALALAWIVVLNVLGRGDAEPLPYLPLLGPVDVTLAALAVAVVGWWHALRRSGGAPRLPGPAVARAVAAGLAFLWLNALLARSVHQWTDVAFRLGPLWRSVPLQVSLSIAWTLVALAGMWSATRRRERVAWIAFATLLGVVVVKLFAVDLSQLSTGAKIGTFLVVGVLLLVVGWLSPVPPGGDAGDAQAPEGGAS
ncbi:MAG TPA: DUF2339 domain-containing protein, partial [Myxococcota bacterium]|nr:DUF2339 domain-containing protein [Myxococcota bacterium]